MRYMLLTLMLVFGVSFSQAQQWLPFTDTAGNFTASYPDTWTLKIKEGNRVFFTSPMESDQDDFRQNINISVTKSADFKDLTIRSLAPDLVSNLESQYDNFKLISQRYFTWNGIESFEVVYTFTKEGLKFPVRLKQWMCTKKEALYMVTYTAADQSDAFSATAVKIMTGIKF